MSKQQNDADLISCYYSAADDQALAQFVQKHRTWAIKRARRYISQDEAEDVVQASIIRLMSAEPVGGRVNNPLGWWHTVISSTAKDFIRESSRRASREYTYTRDLCARTSMCTDGDDSDLVSAIYDEICRTDIRFRDPLLKRYFEDLTYDEIAHQLDLRPGTVASRLARGIERVRAALESKGIYVPSKPSEIPKMSTDSILKTNVASFVERWRDVWIVSMHDQARGIGHLSASAESNGDLILRYRLDIALDAVPTGNPRESTNRLWFENEFSIEDVSSFTWSSFRTVEGATDSANAAMAKHGMHYDQDQLIECSSNGKELSIHSTTGTTTMDVAGEGPLLPDVNAAFYVCQLPRDSETVSPIRLIGFERTLEGRQWGVHPTEVRYAGRSGPPVGLSHTFQIGMKAEMGRNGYVWTNDEGAFVGMGDERESFITVENEDAALDLIERRL